MEITAIVAAAEGAPSIPLQWMLLGFCGQLLFGSRFLVQWIASERAGKSIVPTAFWLLSIAGACFLLTYAIYRQDPVFILGQSMGFLVYTRNLMLISKSREEAADGDVVAPAVDEIPA